MRAQWTPEAPVGWDVAGTLKVERRGDSGYSLSFPTGETWDFNSQGNIVG